LAEITRLNYEIQLYLHTKQVMLDQYDIKFIVREIWGFHTSEDSYVLSFDLWYRVI